MKEEKDNQNNNISIQKIKALSLNIIYPNTKNNNMKTCYNKTVSFKNDLKYKNSITTSNNGKYKSKRKLVTSLSSDYLKEIQKEIINIMKKNMKYMIKKIWLMKYIMIIKN